MISILWYTGKANSSPALSDSVKDIPAAQIWLKNRLEWLLENSYGFSFWESFSWDNGPNQRAGTPKTFLSWHRDRTDCYGRLYNPETGWEFIVDAKGKIKENYLKPETEDR